jgi:acylphosphatase
MMCLREARGLDVHGHVSNQSDGSVILDIDATPTDGKELTRRIHLAREEFIADEVTTNSESLGRLNGFRIN